ncbi:MAG: hypothetical protein KGY46_02020 [Anaerolineales bacterium]|nr:hypothetical protein [Anaerolineales bacterium]
MIDMPLRVEDSVTDVDGLVITKIYHIPIIQESEVRQRSLLTSTGQAPKMKPAPPESRPTPPAKKKRVS